MNHGSFTLKNNTHMCFELRNERWIFHSQKEHNYVLQAEKWTTDLSLSKTTQMCASSWEMNHGSFTLKKNKNVCFELRNEPWIFHSQKEYKYVLRAKKWTTDLSLSKRTHICASSWEMNHGSFTLKKKTPPRLENIITI